MMNKYIGKMFAAVLVLICVFPTCVYADLRVTARMSDWKRCGWTEGFLSFIETAHDDLIEDREIRKGAWKLNYLLADARTTLLSIDDISDFSQQELCYARNEIYARNGRKFKSKELTEYFSAMFWYEGQYNPDQFDEKIRISDVEKANAELIAEYENQKYGGAYKPDQAGYDIFKVRTLGNGKAHSLRELMLQGRLMQLPNVFDMDLDGDGHTERIYYERDENNATITVGEDEYSSYMICPNQAPLGISVDGKTINLLMYDLGDSDDPELHFIRYSDKIADEVGLLNAFPGDLIADPQKGFLYGCCRCSVMGTTYYNCKWYIDEWGYLELVPQEYYLLETYQGTTVAAKLLQDIIVYADMSTASSSSLLKPQNVSALYTDTVNWVYLVGEDGTEGWYQVPSQTEQRSIFSGLGFAD